MFDGLFGTQSAQRRERKEPRLSNMAEGETVTSSDSVRMVELFGHEPTWSGAVVNERTAMRTSAVYASVRLIAGALAGVPKSIYERVENGPARKVKHDYWWLLNERPCASFSAATFWEFVATQFLLREDAICYLVRNRAGVVTAIIPWPRSRVEIQRVLPKDPRDQAYNRYFFQADSGYFGADEDDVLHFPGFGFDGRTGMSVIQWGARNGIGIALRSDEFAGKFFSQGAQPQFALKATGKMTPTQQDELRAAWIAKYSGNGPNGIPLVLTEGVDVKELTMSAVDAQLLESRQWNVVDIARAFGLPPFMIGEMGKATYNNTENLGADVVKYALGPHFRRVEQEINIKMYRSPRYFMKCNVDGLMRGDLKGRSEYYKAALGGTQSPAWMTSNEVRELEELPPRPDGNELAKPKDKPEAAKPTEERDDDQKPPVEDRPADS
jgi:HK97 family phage portal protein